MPGLLIVQPDSVEADALREALRAHTTELDDVIVAESLGDALSSIDLNVPDVVLLPALIPAIVADYVITYLRTIPSAGHVQILGLPRLKRSDDLVEQPARSQFPFRRQEPRAVLTVGCDPGVFTQDVIAYLASAKALKKEIERSSAQAVSKGLERRREPRFANAEVPWISVVSFGDEQAALINVSSRGALLRIQSRPEHPYLRRSDPNVRKRSRLTLELDSDTKLQAMGRVIRCVPLRTSAPTQYEIAFHFEESVGLHLPGAALIPARSVSTEDDL
jgi:hypothetical protein